VSLGWGKSFITAGGEKKKEFPYVIDEVESGTVFEGRKGARSLHRVSERNTLRGPRTKGKFALHRGVGAKALMGDRQPPRKKI